MMSETMGALHASQSDSAISSLANARSKSLEKGRDVRDGPRVTRRRAKSDASESNRTMETPSSTEDSVDLMEDELMPMSPESVDFVAPKPTAKTRKQRTTPTRRSKRKQVNVKTEIKCESDYSDVIDVES